MGYARPGQCDKVIQFVLVSVAGFGGSGLRSVSKDPVGGGQVTEIFSIRA